MITSIKIQNYKLFKSFSLEDIPNIALIGGKNNSGKTSLLEALFMSLDCSNPAMFMRHLDWRGLSSFSNNAESLFAPSFHNFDLKKSITFEYCIHSKKKKLSYKFYPGTNQPIIIKSKDSIQLQRGPNKDRGRVEISYGTEEVPKASSLYLTEKGLDLNITELLIKYNENMRATFVDSNHPSSKENPIRYGELDKINKTEAIVEGLKILEPQLKSLSLIPMGDEVVIHGDVGGMEEKIPISLMGQDIVRLLSILLAISQAKGGLVLIDEIESGFHHSVLDRIWQSISSYASANNTQIIATTHSLELVSGAVKGISEQLRQNFKYMRLERDKEGFKIKDYSFKDLSIALDSDLEIR